MALEVCWVVTLYLTFLAGERSGVLELGSRLRWTERKADRRREKIKDA